MIVGTGVDIAEVHRIRESIERFGDRFLHRIYTEGEIQYCERKNVTRFESYAARFAAKEAGMKALGTGWRGGVGWHDFEVVRPPDGPPVLRVRGEAARLARRRRLARWHLTITHSRTTAIAWVLVERR